MQTARYRIVLVSLLFLSGLLMFGQGVYIHTKAYLAQKLIANAWDKTLESNGKKIFRPWSWADTYPIARLTVPRLGVDEYVLHGSNGPSLAFGPGMDMASYLPTQGGTTLVGGHRDTSFEFLKDIKDGDDITWQDRYGEFHIYEIKGTKIIDSTKEKIKITKEKKVLLLVTCWPFDAIVAGGPKRFVATAVKKG
jgi:sortase A